ncbi:MAG: phosphatase [Clostridia bacterium]|nr:phosphatase [Clostridia bacterium]
MQTEMKILTDIHTHTLATPHAYSTITENAKQASELGLQAIAMTDHSGGLDAPHFWHFMNFKALPKEIYGVRILNGIETDITDIHGTLDTGEEILKKLDIVVASIHRPTYTALGTKDNTEAYMAAVENPFVDIIGHSGAPDIAYDYEAVIKRAKDLGKMIEINQGTFRMRPQNIPTCREIALWCKKLGAGICVNSDAHFWTDIGKRDDAINILREIDFPEELIMNRNLETLKEFLKPRKNI